MIRYFLVGLLLATLPLAAQANDMSVMEPTPTPTTAPTTVQGSPTGPAASSSSSTDSGALQPAGLNPLQSTTSDATGLTAPNANALQAPADSTAALKVLEGEFDGPSQSTDEDPYYYWRWLGLTLLIGFIVSAGAMIVRDRRRFAQTDLAP